MPVEWPSLCGIKASEHTLHYDVAAYGKVQNTIGFRWIAKSPDFPPTTGLEASLSLGSEDLCGRTFCWRHIENAYFAVHCYVGSAVEREGRRGNLDKQIIHWRRDSKISPMIAAFALLSKVAGFTGGAWTREWRAWEDDEKYVGVIPPEECSDIPVSTDLLDSWIQQSLAALREWLPCDQVSACLRLVLFYAALLSKHRPAPLFLTPPNNSRPDATDTPPPELFATIVAAILLPLPAPDAAAISIAAGLPSSNFSAGSRNWDAIAVSMPGVQVHFWPATFEVDAVIFNQAERMARAVLSRNPSELRVGEMLTNNLGGMASALHPDRNNGETVLLHLDADIRDGIPKPIVSSDHLAERPLRPSNSTEAFEQFAFGSLRMIEPHVISDNDCDKEITAPIEIAYLHWVHEQFIRFLEAGELHFSGSRGHFDPAACLHQLRVKSDLLRSWLYILAPSDETIRRAGIPEEGGRVPALWMATCLGPPDAVRRLGKLGESELTALIHQSLSVRMPMRRAKRLQDRLTAWAGCSDCGPLLREIINRESITTPAV